MGFSLSISCFGSHRIPSNQYRIQNCYTQNLKTANRRERYLGCLIDKDRVQGLIFPKITFDFAGLNSGLVLGQAQDFSKGYKEVRDELATLYSVVGIEQGISQIFLLGKEPDKSLDYNHQLWSEFRELKGIKYIESDTNLDEVVDFVREHDVVPLSEMR